MDITISVRNLVKIYKVGPEKVVALAGVSFDVQKGEICCILGTSGSGKSTLLNMLAGLEKPTAGEILIDGTSIGKLSEKKITKWRQQNIGFVFQSYNLIPGLTALENVAMPLVFRGVNRRRRKRLAQVMLIMVGLGRRMRHRASQMSGGQQQRVGIARAFVSSPRIVFADEPTGNLDSRTTKDVMELMVKMSKKHNHSLILVTHDSQIAAYADRIITLSDGMVTSDRRNEKAGIQNLHTERIAK
ncbi:MAG: ABC transporter ATP-binding protein [Oscillospiraceae bacterium]|nr:ABC transporter ATP-binding protein [Oscillospiraceae bacterium]